MKRIKNEEIQAVDMRYDEGLRGRSDPNCATTITTKSSGFTGRSMIMEKVNDTHTHTHTHKHSHNESANLRIRKLTPKECMRLMGFADEDYESLVSVGLNETAIYKLAGDSIITTCLIGLVGAMTDLDFTKIIENYVERIKEQ